MDDKQLSLDFSVSAAQRQRRAKMRIERAQNKPLKLFTAPPNMDIHLFSPNEAIADFTSDPDVCAYWLTSLVGPLRSIKNRSAAFPTAALDKLLWVRPPAHITLDAASSAVAKALWANKLGFKPLNVTRRGRRLLASSARWPAGLRVQDAPWTTITTLVKLGVHFEVNSNAHELLLDRLGLAGTPIATAGLAGSAVIIQTLRPDLMADLNIPALSYSGGTQSGIFKMPLLASEMLLSLPQIQLSDDLRTAISKLTKPASKLVCDDTFPWTLYNFQSRDAGKAARILEVTGGVLLAGEMGSGKTTVALALAHNLNLWPLLVVAPLTAFSTWSQQLGEMGKKYYMATDPPAKAWAAIKDPTLDAVIMSYDRLHLFAELIEQRSFKCIIADEIQRIRSPGSRRSRSLRALAASTPVRIGLSGTPLTNTISDLLPIGSFLVPSEWRPRASSKTLHDTYVGDPVESIADHLGSMMVRRKMDDTGTKLPTRNDHRVYVQLTSDQRRALDHLEQEARASKKDGEFNEPTSRMHAFARLQKMRQIVNAPASAGVPGPNPKVVAAMELVEDFIAMDRKGVLFCADRATFRELGKCLTDAKIGWVGLWGATPAHQRVINERNFHADPNIKVVLCTIQAGSEAWSASPSATWLISTAYMYAPATLSQMEARVYRMNSDPNGPEIEILYVHAKCPNGSLDDRMLEILEIKKHLFAQVVDRSSHIDNTTTHYSLSDLVYLLTGEHDDGLKDIEHDEAAILALEADRKDKAKYSLKKYKTGSSGTSSHYTDDDTQAMTLEEFEAIENSGELDTEDMFEVLETKAKPIDDWFQK
jgi:hypothetical protein